MGQNTSEVFTFTTSISTYLSRNEELPTPLIAKCIHSKVFRAPGDVFSAKLKIDILSGSRNGDATPAWDLVHVFSATGMSNLEDGWCVLRFDGFDGQPAVLHLDCPKGAFKFRFRVKVYVMRQREGEELEVSVRDNARVEYAGSCMSPVIQVVE